MCIALERAHRAAHSRVLPTERGATRTLARVGLGGAPLNS
jgi:hypothetical protein